MDRSDLSALVGGNAALMALAAARTPRPEPAPRTRQCSHGVQPIQRETGPHGYPSAEGLERQRDKLIRRGLDPDRCAHRSSYTVGGTPYCAIHARIVALTEAGIASAIADDVHTD